METLRPLTGVLFLLKRHKVRLVRAWQEGREPIFGSLLICLFSMSSLVDLNHRPLGLQFRKHRLMINDGIAPREPVLFCGRVRPLVKKACFSSNINLIVRWLIQCRALHSNSNRRASCWECRQKTFKTWSSWGSSVPPGRNRVCWFDTNLLLEAKVALYLKETLGSSSDLLARFTEAFSKNLGKAKMADLGDIRLLSRPLDGTSAVEIKIPVRSLARELRDQIPLRLQGPSDLPKGRKKAGWKKSFLRRGQEAAADLGDISEEQLLRTVREYRSGRKKQTEITVVARTGTKTA
jgi:hypothetical protein